MDDREKIRREILKPELDIIMLRTPFALCTIQEGYPYKIIRQDGEYCTFQAMTSEEFHLFLQEKAKELGLWKPRYVTLENHENISLKTDFLSP